MKELDRAIYDKYIRPTEKKRDFSIGIEIEMPVVNLSGEPVEEEAVLEVSDVFRKHFGFDVQSKDDNGCINSITDRSNGDNLSFDCCYSNLELSMGVGDDLIKIHERFKKLYTFLLQQYPIPDPACCRTAERHCAQFPGQPVREGGTSAQDYCHQRIAHRARCCQAETEEPECKRAVMPQIRYHI